MCAICIGDEWCGHYDDARWHVVDFFTRENQTFHFTDGSYTGGPGDILVMNVNRTDRKHLIRAETLLRYYTRVKKGRNCRCISAD